MLLISFRESTTPCKQQSTRQNYCKNSYYFLHNIPAFNASSFSASSFSATSFFIGQLLVIQLDPLTDKSHRRLFRVAVLTGGFICGLQKIFQQVILRDAEKIVPVDFPQIMCYLVYVLLYHIAAKAVLVNVDGDYNCLNCGSVKPGLCSFIMVALTVSTIAFALCTCFAAMPFI